jgi:hypothetical protein
MMSDGTIKDLSEGREIVLKSSLVETFEPEDESSWSEAKQRFAELCS